MPDNRSFRMNGLPRWFDPRGRAPGGWAFILNRLTALGLTFYLGLHLIVLGKLAGGPGAYDDFVALAHSTWMKAAEVILIAAVLFHGLNGLRLILHALGLGVHRQRLWAAVTAVLAALASLWMALRIFSL